MKLKKEEEQIFELLQHYPKLKLLEVWKTVEKDLEDNRVKTLFSDYHFMRTNREEIQKLLSHAIEKQIKISESINHEKKIELNKFYDIIRNNKK